MWVSFFINLLNLLYKTEFHTIRTVSYKDKFIIIASDGVFEFLTNQMVADIVGRHSDPLDACKAVVAAAYNVWLQYEVRTDDITIITLFVDDMKRDQEAESDRPLRKRVPSMEIVDARPVRRAMSREKKKNMIQLKEEFNDAVEDDWDEKKESLLVTAKTEKERYIINSAIKSNFLFQHLTSAQRDQVIDLMRPVIVKPGDWVIQQFDQGDKFYVVETGRLEVRVRSAPLADKARVPTPHDDPYDGTSGAAAAPLSDGDRERIGGAVVHVYESGPEQHPSFGELSLM